jgi:hypothetical protein
MKEPEIIPPSQIEEPDMSILNEQILNLNR